MSGSGARRARRPPARLTPEAAAALVRDIYGLAPAEVTPLGGERDENMLVATEAGDRWILKVISPDESPEVTAFLDALLTRVGAADLGVPVPSVLPPARPRGDGGPVWAGREVRLLSFLPGRAVDPARASSRQRRDLGRRLALLDRALAGWLPAAASRSLKWNAERAAGVAAGWPDFPWVAEHLGGHLRAQVTGLRRQVIHNDANPQNVLMDASGVTGIIDVGDAIVAPLVQEVATAAAYHVGADPSHPLHAPREIVRAYDAVLPLTRAERDALFDLMLARLVLIAVLTDRAARARPDDAAYLLRNQALAVRAVGDLTAVGCAAGTAYLTQAP